jgi:hypothetical protein
MTYVALRETWAKLLEEARMKARRQKLPNCAMLPWRCASTSQPTSLRRRYGSVSPMSAFGPATSSKAGPNLTCDRQKSGKHVSYTVFRSAGST